MQDRFFELSSYHVLMAATGVAILVAHLLPRLLFRRPVSAYALLMLLGLLSYLLVPGMPAVLDPTASPGL